MTRGTAVPNLRRSRSKLFADRVLHQIRELKSDTRNANLTKMGKLSSKFKQKKRAGNIKEIEKVRVVKHDEIRVATREMLYKQACETLDSECRASKSCSEMDFAVCGDMCEIHDKKRCDVIWDLGQRTEC